MDWITVVLIAVGLAMDAFAVSIAKGITVNRDRRRTGLLLAGFFGVFQMLMPLIGWAAGYTLRDIIMGVDHWIAFGLLAFVGGRMIRSGFDVEGETYAQDPSRGKTLVMLSIATSLDALAIGLSLALLKVTIWYPAAVIGVVTAGLSFLGLQLGKRLGEKFGKRMEVVGGAILVIIGLRILVSHLLA